MILTQGEKMVWAARFVQKYDISKPPSECLRGAGSRDRWRQWEIETAVSAAESACYAVRRLREIGDKVSEGYGDDSEVSKMFRAMLGDEG